jgi:hypothetical protein
LRCALAAEQHVAVDVEALDTHLGVVDGRDDQPRLGGEAGLAGRELVVGSGVRAAPSKGAEDHDPDGPDGGDAARWVGTPARECAATASATGRSTTLREKAQSIFVGPHGFLLRAG